MFTQWVTDCIFLDTWIQTWQQPSLTHEYVHDNNLLTHNTTTFNDTAAETPHRNTSSNHQHGFLHNFVVKGLQLQLQSQCGRSDHFVFTQLPVPLHGYVQGDSRRTPTLCGREHSHNRDSRIYCEAENTVTVTAEHQHCMAENTVTTGTAEHTVRQKTLSQWQQENTNTVAENTVTTGTAEHTVMQKTLSQWQQENTNTVWQRTLSQQNTLWGRKHCHNRDSRTHCGAENTVTVTAGEY